MREFRSVTSPKRNAPASSTPKAARARRRRPHAVVPRGPAPESEPPCVLDEEVTPFREEQREAGEIDLLLVHLHLRELGPIREVQREPGAQAPLEVAARVECDVPAGRQGRKARGPGGDGG